MKSCHNNVDDYILGSKGKAQVLVDGAKGRINGETVFRGKKPNMYDQEHKELFAAIRAGTPINNGRYMSLSTGNRSQLSILAWDMCE